MGKGKNEEDLAGTWVIQGVPRELMRRVKIAAAVEDKSVKQLLLDLAESHLNELEKKGMMPKVK